MPQLTLPQTNLRRGKINAITQAILQMQKDDREIMWDKFLFEVMQEFCITRRTALEYIQTAKIQANLQKETIAQEIDKEIQNEFKI